MTCRWLTGGRCFSLRYRDNIWTRLGSRPIEQGRYRASIISTARDPLFSALHPRLRGVAHQIVAFLGQMSGLFVVKLSWQVVVGFDSFAEIHNLSLFPNLGGVEGRYYCWCSFGSVGKGRETKKRGEEAHCSGRFLDGENVSQRLVWPAQEDMGSLEECTFLGRVCKLPSGHVGR